MPPTRDDFSQRLNVALQSSRKRSPAAESASASAIGTATLGKTSDNQSPHHVVVETTPVGVGSRLVRQGDCMSSIARQTGHFWETLWNDPANSELHGARLDPNVLLIGDRVTVPAVRPKLEPGATEMRHRFVRRGEPSKLRMQVLRDNQPLGNQPYELVIDKKITRTGTTDPEGKIETPIPGDAKRGELWVGLEPKRYRYTLGLGAVQPVDALDGVQQRLKNLGFFGGAVDGKPSNNFKLAVKAFQDKNSLPQTGEADDATREKLKEIHGC